MSKKTAFSFWYILIVLWGLMILHTLTTQPAERVEQIPYSQFETYLAQGQIEEVHVGPTYIEGTLKAPTKGQAKQFLTFRVEPDLAQKLGAQHVKFTGAAENTTLQSLLAWILPALLFAAVWMLLMRRTANKQGVGSGFLSVGKSKAKVYLEKDIKVSFADVAGVEEAKTELQEAIEFLKRPEKFRRLGGKIPKGILLVGPPGTGKTLLAKAVAGEAGVPFFSISGSEFVEMFVGVGAARVRDLFLQAKEKAPCVIFIDEMDALGKARGVGPMWHEEREQTLNQLLVEMDGFDSRVGVILLAATNRPEILDPALLRAGRFDRRVLVDRPDKTDRVAILRIHARGVPLAADADLDMIAAMTAGFAGADLANIVNEAALLSARHEKNQVGLAELQEAVERVVAGLEKKNRVLRREEKERVAYHELGHALVGLALPGTDPIQKISIIPRGVAALGYTLQLPTEDRFLMTKSELENKLAILLGGRVAEEIIYGEISTGAQDDLLKATGIAKSMVKTYGMSEHLGQVSLGAEHQSLFLQTGQPTAKDSYSEATAREIDAEIRRIIEAQHHRVTNILGGRQEVLREAAAVLLRQETMTGDELRALASQTNGHSQRVVSKVTTIH